MPGTVHYRLEDIVLGIETGHAHEGLIAAIDDHVDDIVDRNPAEQIARPVDHRRREQIALFETHGDFVGRPVDQDRLDILHDFAHRLVARAGDDVLQRQDAEIDIAAIDDDQVIGLLGQFAANSQVTQYYIQLHFGTHGDDVDVHQAAGGVLRIR